MGGKQYRPWSDAAFCGVWSGSKLFIQTCLYEYIRSVNMVIRSDRHHPRNFESLLNGPCYAKTYLRAYADKKAQISLYICVRRRFFAWHFPDNPGPGPDVRKYPYVTCISGLGAGVYAYDNWLWPNEDTKTWQHSWLKTFCSFHQS